MKWNGWWGTTRLPASETWGDGVARCVALHCVARLRWFFPAALLALAALRACSCPFPPALLAFAALRVRGWSSPPALLALAALRACSCPFPPALLALAALRVRGWARTGEAGARSPAHARQRPFLVRLLKFVNTAAGTPAPWQWRIGPAPAHPLRQSPDIFVNISR